MASLLAARLNARTLDAWLARIGRIGPESARRWGSMGPAAMLAHLRRSLEISLEEIRVPDMHTWVTATFAKWLFFDLPTPWPRGTIKAPEFFFPEGTESVEEEKRLLADALRRFVAAQESAPARRTLTPVFGMKTLHYWGRIHGRHMEHHLRQFGV